MNIKKVVYLAATIVFLGVLTLLFAGLAEMFVSKELAECLKFVTPVVIGGIGLGSLWWNWLYDKDGNLTCDGLFKKMRKEK